MQLRLLRIDETMLPFMNGDGLEDVPTFMKCASYIEYTKIVLAILLEADFVLVIKSLKDKKI